jgi:hypothetical protein
VVARDVDRNGHVHFLLVLADGVVTKFAVDEAGDRHRPVADRALDLSPLSQRFVVGPS